jgi:hypothetical protein
MKIQQSSSRHDAGYLFCLGRLDSSSGASSTEAAAPRYREHSGLDTSSPTLALPVSPGTAQLANVADDQSRSGARARNGIFPGSAALSQSPNCER